MQHQCFYNSSKASGEVPITEPAFLKRREYFTVCTINRLVEDLHPAQHLKGLSSVSLHLLFRSGNRGKLGPGPTKVCNHLPDLCASCPVLPPDTSYYPSHLQITGHRGQPSGGWEVADTSLQLHKLCSDCQVYSNPGVVYLLHKLHSLSQYDGL